MILIQMILRHSGFVGALNGGDFNMYYFAHIDKV